ncbi:unnamed protein product [Auanema sp. JU1783]|nr:unnamed protein product [Auanema sp. JU1783]
MSDDGEEINCLLDETRLLMVDGKLTEFKVHLKLGYLANIIENYHTVNVSCRYRIYESYFEMSGIVKEMQNAAQPIIQAAMYSNIKTELRMWMLPDNAEAILNYVKNAMEVFKTDLMEAAVVMEGRGAKLRELKQSLTDIYPPYN